MALFNVAGPFLGPSHMEAVPMSQCFAENMLITQFTNVTSAMGECMVFFAL
jgi:hypothetical protein